MWPIQTNTRHDAHLRTSLKIKGSLIRIRCYRYVDTTRCGLLDRGRLQIDLAYDPRSPFAGLMCGKNVPLNQPQHRHLAHPQLSCCLVECELSAFCTLATPVQGNAMHRPETSNALLRPCMPLGAAHAQTIEQRGDTEVGHLSRQGSDELLGTRIGLPAVLAGLVLG
jgi:hypothetical protein